MKLEFGVKSAYASVYLAFIEEVTKLGWTYNGYFNRVENVDKYLGMNTNSCLWLSFIFSTYHDKPAMSFSNHSNDALVINLDEGFDKGIKQAIELLKEQPKKETYKLTTDYNAVIEKTGITVGCQHIEFSTFEELARIVADFRNKFGC